MGGWLISVIGAGGLYRFNSFVVLAGFVLFVLSFPFGEKVLNPSPGSGSIPRVKEHGWSRNKTRDWLIYISSKKIKHSHMVVSKVLFVCTLPRSRGCGYIGGIFYGATTDLSRRYGFGNGYKSAFLLLSACFGWGWLLRPIMFFCWIARTFQPLR